MALTALDILVFVLVAAGLVFGFLRGFVAEILSLFAWILAILALSYFHEPVSATLEGPVGSGAWLFAFVLVFGEVALSGELRPVAHAPLRMKEAAKLGFERAIVPAAVGAENGALRVSGFRTLGQLVDHLLGR